MNLIHKTVDNQNEVVEVKKPGKIKTALTNAKTKIKSNKYLNAGCKAVAIALAAGGGYVVGRLTSKHGDDDDDQVYDDFEYIDDELEDSADN